ncbi:MAG: glycosyltransferase [Ignavibacteria bacterium]|nr:glycosyltransferase [Ignavibacteria bacterium]
MSAPLVSVLMPVRNARPYLAEAVRAVLGQTEQDFELLVCDDASEDGSMEVVEAFRDPRIRMLRGPETPGVVGAVNTCIDAARGVPREHGCRRPHASATLREADPDSARPSRDRRVRHMDDVVRAGRSRSVHPPGTPRGDRLRPAVSSVPDQRHRDVPCIPAGRDRSALATGLSAGGRLRLAAAALPRDALRERPGAAVRVPHPSGADPGRARA